MAQVYSFDITTRTTPLSMNARLHWAAKAKQTAELRENAETMARITRVPRNLGRVRVTLHYAPRDRRRRDPINLAPTLKAIQDGLVDHGVVPDDTPQFMESPMPVIHEPTGKHGHLWVTVEPLPTLVDPVADAEGEVA